jgi:hypothetical protein
MKQAESSRGDEEVELGAMTGPTGSTQQGCVQSRLGIGCLLITVFLVPSVLPGLSKVARGETGPTAMPNRAMSEAPSQVPLRYYGPDPTETYFLPRDVFPPSPETALFGTVESQAAGQDRAVSGVRAAGVAFGTSGQSQRMPPPRFVFPEAEATDWEPAPSESAGWTPRPWAWLNPTQFLHPSPPEPDGGFVITEEPVATLEPLAMTPRGIRPHKEGFFQKLSLTGTWLDRGTDTNDFGETEADLFATFALPAPYREWPVLLTPGFNFRMLDGPATADLPPRLYEAYFDVTWVPRWNARWTSIIGVAPGVYSDFETSDHALRITGKALARYDWHPDQLQLIFGVLYLDRYDITWLPAGGLIWMPDAGRKYEFLFPQPKLAHRILCTDRFEDWFYIGAEIGGNSYVTETVGAITLRGYRIYLGLERKLDGGAGFRLELGYVTGREIEFESQQAPIEASDTAMIRGGVTF